jgi:DNA repair protein RecO (recombination protein O)
VDEKTTGIILRTRPLTETSLIVHWLTPDSGRIATVAKGARRPKSPFRGKLDLFYLAEFSFVRSRRSELHTLRELSVREMHATLRRELGWLEQAAYVTELIELTTETDTPLPELFALFRDFLKFLPSTPPQPQTVFAFEMKLLRELGQAPDLSSCQLSAGTKQILERITELEWPALSRLKPSAAQLREMQQFLHGFLTHHLGRIPKGRTA